MQYSIFEGNMERLTKKMTRIQNKCKRYGCEFHFEEVGEEFRDIKTGEDIEGKPIYTTTRFVIVEAEGLAIVNDWQFVASIDHTEEGNIINKAVDIEIPDRYYKNSPVCEHCGNRRVRHTFIVQNTITGEFKQVGRSCLKDFTQGMSAEGVAEYTSAFEELIVGETPYAGCRVDTYITTTEFLRYVAECVRHFGYTKNEPGVRSTRDRAFDYWEVDNNPRMGEKRRDALRAEMREVGFNANSPEAEELTTNALAWLFTQSEDNNYMHNLITACKLTHSNYKRLGIISSLFPTYNRDLEVQAKKKAEAEVKAVSDFVGGVGERIEVGVSEIRCVTGWETQWGYTYIYKIVSTDKNVFTWKTSVDVDMENVKTIKGTVKEHKEYCGEKQTELTRCKLA